MPILISSFVIKVPIYTKMVHFIRRIREIYCRLNIISFYYRLGERMSAEIKSQAQSKFEQKLVQEKFNINVAFYVHLKAFDNNTRKELKAKIEEVFFFTKGVDWKFDSFGIEKSGSRGTDVLGYFIFRACDEKKLQKLFMDEFKDYANALKITCSVAKYEKVDEQFFELEI